MGYCFIYSKRRINCISAIISILIFAIINLCVPKSNNVNVSAHLIESEISQELVFAEDLRNEDIMEWKLEIPKINLKALIKSGTDDENLNQYIGHFEDTPCRNGNIGLAAHNRGYNVNYFARIKELEKGDEIFYTYNGEKVEFQVLEKGIIEETDWSKLENTEDTRLTLITCVEDKPEYRRYVQAVMKMEEKE